MMMTRTARVTFCIDNFDTHTWIGTNPKRLPTPEYCSGQRRAACRSTAPCEHNHKAFPAAFTVKLRWSIISYQSNLGWHASSDISCW